MSVPRNVRKASRQACAPELLWGWVNGLLTPGLTMMKCLPRGYNRDFHENEETLFRSVELASRITAMLTPLVDVIMPNKERMASLPSQNFFEGSCGAAWGAHAKCGAALPGRSQARSRARSRALLACSARSSWAWWSSSLADVVFAIVAGVWGGGVALSAL